MHLGIADDEFVADGVVVVHDEEHGRAGADADVVGGEMAVLDRECHGDVAGPEWRVGVTVGSGERVSGRDDRDEQQRDQ
jgi:hypothetical protein